MMSARPSRSISSRMAGVSAVWGTAPPYHRQRASAARHPADRPVGVRLARAGSGCWRPCRSGRRSPAPATSRPTTSIGGRTNAPTRTTSDSPTTLSSRRRRSSSGTSRSDVSSSQSRSVATKPISSSVVEGLRLRAPPRASLSGVDRPVAAQPDERAHASAISSDHGADGDPRPGSPAWSGSHRRRAPVARSDVGRAASTIVVDAGDRRRRRHRR